MTRTDHYISIIIQFSFSLIVNFVYFIIFILIMFYLLIITRPLYDFYKKNVFISFIYSILIGIFFRRVTVPITHFYYKDIASRNSRLRSTGLIYIIDFLHSITFFSLLETKINAYAERRNLKNKTNKDGNAKGRKDSQDGPL